MGSGTAPRLRGGDEASGELPGEGVSEFWPEPLGPKVPRLRCSEEAERGRCNPCASAPALCSAEGRDERGMATAPGAVVVVVGPAAVSGEALGRECEAPSAVLPLAPATPAADARRALRDGAA
jgi:hypothetical protein